LRGVFGDPLFLRTSHGIARPRARALAGPVREAMRLFDRELGRWGSIRRHRRGCSPWSPAIAARSCCCRACWARSASRPPACDCCREGCSRCSRSLARGDADLIIGCYDKSGASPRAAAVRRALCMHRPQGAPAGRAAADAADLRGAEAHHGVAERGCAERDRPLRGHQLRRRSERQRLGDGRRGQVPRSHAVLQAPAGARLRAHRRTGGSRHTASRWRSGSLTRPIRRFRRA
jgi:hypothetical protein